MLKKPRNLSVEGKPVMGVTVGICQTNRGAEQFAGEYVIATDEQGRFLFNSVVSDNRMTIYSKMEEGECRCNRNCRIHKWEEWFHFRIG